MHIYNITKELVMIKTVQPTSSKESFKDKTLKYKTLQKKLSKYIKMHDRIVQEKNTIFRAIAEKSATELKKEIQSLLLDQLGTIEAHMLFGQNSIESMLAKVEKRTWDIPEDYIQSEIVACWGSIASGFYEGRFRSNDRITFLTSSDNTIVFTLSKFPNLIFKLPLYGPGIRYYSALIAKKICEDFELNALKVPNMKLLKIKGKSNTVIVEEKSHANKEYEKSPKSFAKNHAKELKPVIKDLVKFICITGMWDIARRNFVLEGDKKLTLSLIDVEENPLLYAGPEDVTILRRRKSCMPIIETIIKDKNLLSKKEWIELGLFGKSNFLKNHPKISERKKKYVKDRMQNNESVIKQFSPKQTFDIIKKVLSTFKYDDLAKHMDYKIEKMALKNGYAIKNESFNCRYDRMYKLYKRACLRQLTPEEKVEWQTMEEEWLQLNREAELDTHANLASMVKDGNFRSFAEKRAIFDNILQPAFQNSEREDFFNYLDNKLQKLNAKTDNPIQKEINKSNYVWLKKFLDAMLTGKYSPNFSLISRMSKEEQKMCKVSKDKYNDDSILQSLCHSRLKTTEGCEGRSETIKFENGETFSLSGIKNNFQKRELLITALKKLEKLGIIFRYTYNLPKGFINIVA